GAEDEVEAAVQCRQALIQVGGDEMNAGRVSGAGQVDAGDGKPALRQDLGQITARAADVENATPIAMARKFPQEQRVAAVRPRLELVASRRLHGSRRHSYLLYTAEGWEPGPTLARCS